MNPRCNFLLFLNPAVWPLLLDPSCRVFWWRTRWSGYLWRLARLRLASSPSWPASRESAAGAGRVGTRSWTIRPLPSSTATLSKQTRPNRCVLLAPAAARLPGMLCHVAVVDSSRYVRLSFVNSGRLSCKTCPFMAKPGDVWHSHARVTSFNGNKRE